MLNLYSFMAGFMYILICGLMMLLITFAHVQIMDYFHLTEKVAIVGVFSWFAIIAVVMIYFEWVKT